MASGLKIGIVAAALSTDPREAVLRARQLGFAGLEFDAQSPHLSLPGLSASGRREFRHVLSGQDQQLVALRVELGNKGFAPGADIDQMIDRVDRAMEAAKGLMTPLVCVDIGDLPEPARAATPRPRLTAEQAGAIIIPTSLTIEAEAAPEPAVRGDAAFESSVDAAMTELGRRADRYSVMVAFRTDLASLAALERALGAADCPWFGVDLDPVAILRDRWGADEVFDQLGPLVRHVRARDAVVGHDRRTKPAVIGRGDTKWEELVQLLDEAGYNGWLCVDPVELADRVAGAREGLGYLKGLRG